jgi:superfamily II DNA or RNA helicase
MHAVGSLVRARGREWVVLPDSDDQLLLLRPLGGGDADVTGLLPALEPVSDATFPPPSADDLGDDRSARLLRDALRIGFRSSAGPFRSLAGLAVEPRPYQLVPLLMALRQDDAEHGVRLLIADDVGIGKTIEAGLVAAELLAQGSAQRLSVLCSPALAEQWQSELRNKFDLDAQLVLPGTIRRLERGLAFSESVFDRHPVTVVSTDFIKAERRRDDFVRTAPELVIVDEAHTCVADGSGAGGKGRTLRYDLLRKLAADRSRHLLLVTATPHSGKEEGFRNLVGLLDPALAEVDLGTEDGRRRLARHLVQRRRQDIRTYLDEETAFPRDRQTREAPYSLSSDYEALVADVLRYARESVRDPTGGLVRQRVRWWSALALLRSLASSPRAAAATLLTRASTAAAETVADADERGRAAVLDLPDDEALEAADVVPGSALDDEQAGTAETRRLRAFAKRAQALEGAPDRKLAVATAQVRELLADGYAPIVFCRFIPTAAYVGEHLRRALGSGVAVEVVDGTLVPEVRVARIAELATVPGPRVLVATDCLSEGVNLQDQFSAVVHYDLAWNPTRHEQREGRVDRFGQRADVVRAVTVYGTDNGIDGIVLDVLLRKHEQIRRTLGVSVPVPADSDTVVEAVLEGLLLRGRDQEQYELDLGLQTQRAALHEQWTSSAEREQASRTLYRQATVREEEVAPEVAEVRAALGTHLQVEQFVQAALEELGEQPVPTADGLTAAIAQLPVGLQDALGGAARLTFVRDHPVPPGAALLARTDPAVAALARFLLDAALDPALPEHWRPARRAAVVRTRAVSTPTALLLARFRFSLDLPARGGTSQSVVESAHVLAFSGPAVEPCWLDGDQVASLLQARADANLPPDVARNRMSRALRDLPSLVAALDAEGDRLAAALEESHRRVRRAARGRKSGVLAVRGLTVTPQRPADLLGLYLYLPVGEAP